MRSVSHCSMQLPHRMVCCRLQVLLRRVRHRGSHRRPQAYMKPTQEKHLDADQRMQQHVHQMVPKSLEPVVMIIKSKTEDDQRAIRPKDGETVHVNDAM